MVEKITYQSFSIAQTPLQGEQFPKYIPLTTSPVTTKCPHQDPSPLIRMIDKIPMLKGPKKYETQSIMYLMQQWW